MLAVRLCLPLLLCLGIAQSQTFEVASIRPSGPKSQRGSNGGPGGKDPTLYTFNRASLSDLILVAYHVELFCVSSKLPLDLDEFDLAARVPAGVTKDEFRAMLRNLLTDRFHLKARMENREFPALEMVLAKGGAKVGTAAAMRSAATPDFPQLSMERPGMIARNSVSNGFMLTQILGHQQPLSRLAEILRTAEPRPVVDHTGMTGTYDFSLVFSTELQAGISDGAAQPPSAPDLDRALREQLGLQLVAKKLPFDVVIVESVDRLPTEN